MSSRLNIKFETIVADRDLAIYELETFQKNRKVFQHSGFNDAQIEAMEKERKEIFNTANDKLWEAFKYPLEIFDLENGDLPENGEMIYVYDEYDFEWIRAEITQTTYAGSLRFAQGNKILGSPNEFERYIRWTRLPILKR